jgi:mannose-1-phosphate guanylyltransferase
VVIHLFSFMNKTNKALFAVIMAGGRGERFWPLGRNSLPKQFVSIFGGKPLIRHAVERLDGLVPLENILVVTSADLVEQTVNALPMLPKENIVGEPFGRDTAAACALGTALVEKRGGTNAVLAILTADHLMKRPDIFRETLADAASVVASEDRISVIGITPQYPATGFGYINVDGKLQTDTATKFHRVSCFVEKPNIERAKIYIESGHHYWNSGMFIWSVNTFKNALEKYCPTVKAMYDAVLPTIATPVFDATLLAEYNKLEKISVDYAIMEKAENIVSAVGNFGWDDVGTWISAGEHFPADDDGNRVYGDAVVLDSANNVAVNCIDGHLVGMFGVDDLIVVHTSDATLIASKQAAPELKKLVRELSSDDSHKKFT